MSESGFNGFVGVNPDSFHSHVFPCENAFLIDKNELGGESEEVCAISTYTNIYKNSF